eukprot:m.76131 g.76131  ORF g.76131 m.76131 type:complete len:70 (+) comp14012_c5_seq1:240-449(+)
MDWRSRDVHDYSNRRVQRAAVQQQQVGPETLSSFQHNINHSFNLLLRMEHKTDIALLPCRSRLRPLTTN